MTVWRGFVVASLVGATLGWTALPTREEPRPRRSPRPAIEALKRVAAGPAARAGERLRSRDAMKLVLLSCFQSR